MAHPYDSQVFRPSSANYVPPPEPLWWLGSGLLPPGGKLLVSALTKVGKSWFAAELTRALCTGTPVGGPCGPWVGRRARVLYLDRELGEFSFYSRWRRYDVMREIGDDLLVMPLRAKMALDNSAEVRRMTDFIVQENVNILVVDPVNRFLSGAITDNQVVGDFLDGIDQLLANCRSLGLAAVLIAHNNKPAKPAGNVTPDPHDIFAIAGGANWVNYSDSVITIAREGKHATGSDGRDYWDVSVDSTVRHGKPVEAFVMRISPESTPPVVIRGANPPGEWRLSAAPAWSHG